MENGNGLLARSHFGHIDKTVSLAYRIYRWWENKMKKIIGIGLLILLASCSSIFSPDQKIIMIDGPSILWPTDEYFYIGGHVQNISDQTLCYIHILIFPKDSAGNFLALRKTQPDEEILASGQISYWSILFYDPDQAIRDKIDLSKLTYKISY